MSAPNEPTQTMTKTRDTDSSLQAGIEIEKQAEFLLDEAREADSEQSSLIDSAPLESQYTAALAAQVDAKHDQTERIEDRLEKLIDLQVSRLQNVQVQQPGFLALPGTRQLWQQKMQRQQNTLQKLRGRLEAVREIKEGMGCIAHVSKSWPPISFVLKSRIWPQTGSICKKPSAAIRP